MRLACGRFESRGTLPASIIFDMEQAETKELILSIFMLPVRRGVVSHLPHAGIALQAYRTDTGDDVQRLLAWTKEPAGADDDPPGERRLLGFRCDPVSAARVADAAVRNRSPRPT